MSEYDVFLSYNRDDADAVKILYDRLRQTGVKPFLDIWNLIPGDDRQKGLEEALDNSATVAIFVGSLGIRQWNNAQMRVAVENAVRTRDDYRVIPILLPGAREETLDGFLGLHVWVDFRSGLDSAEAFERLVAGIKGEAIEAGVYKLPDEPAPYRGLLCFEEEQARFFFGRETDSQALVKKLAYNNFVAVVGASGSGKSSLVRAGLLPRLKPNVLPDSRNWHILIVTPGLEPTRALSEQLATLIPLTDRLKLVDELTNRLSQRADGLRTALTTLLAEDSRPILLVIDQFEELFTLCQEEPKTCRLQAEQFVANLADAVERGNGRIRVLITLRADFLDHCLAIATLRDLLQDRQFLLGALSEPSLREAIIRPAQEVGAYFEKGLVNAILRDVSAEPGILPLLQHALFELWQARSGPWLTLDAYEKSGGVSGALERRAEVIYKNFSTEQQAIARNIFLRLTTIDEGVSDTRRRASRNELYPTGVDPAQVDTVLQVLSGEQARLVVADEESVEIAHEALIQQWGLLRRWLEDGRESLRFHRRLTETATEWERSNHDDGYLFRGTRLIQVEEWSQLHNDQLNPLEETFIEASLHARKARRRTRRWTIFWRWAAAGTTILLIIFAGVLIWQIQRTKSPWQPVLGFPSDPVQALTMTNEESPRYYAGTANIGVARSQEGEWTVYRSGLPTGPPAGGDPWKTVRGIGQVTADILNPQYVFAPVYENGIYMSEDYGETWQAANKGLPNGSDTVAVDLAVYGNVVLAVFNRSANHALYASLDSGKSWEQLGAEEIAPLNRVYTVQISPGRDEVYVGTENGLYRSLLNPPWAWTQVVDHGPILTIVPTASDKDTFYLATENPEGTGDIFQWQPGTPLEKLATLDETPIALAPHPDPNNAIATYVLLFGGEVVAVTHNKQIQSLGRESVLTYDILAIPDSSGSNIRLLLGYDKGLLEYEGELALFK